MTEIVEDIARVNGHPEKVVVFLHGYIDCAENIDKALSEKFLSKLNNCAVHIPQSPVPCEIHERKRQWYSMHRFDPDDSRKTVPDMRKCAAVYDKMTQGFGEAFDYLTPYLDNLLRKYRLADSNLYLCGFSQGAMLALYTALMRKNRIGGCVSFSGIMAPSTYLKKNYRNTPPALLIHGDADSMVRFAALGFTRRRLKKMGCDVRTHTVKGGAHRITEDGLLRAADFINALPAATIKKAAG